VNVGYIPPKGYKTLTVSVTFSDATDARMHFDAYGSTYNGKPCSWSQVTWSPNSEDSTVLYKAGPLPLSVSIAPPSAIIDLGQSVSFTSTVSGGTSPYTYQWYKNGTAVPLATLSSWTFTPTSAGYYNIHLNVTDSTCTKAKSNISPVTVNPSLSMSISPTSSVIKLGQSVTFTSTVSGGTTPYSYQWYKNETAVPLANSSSWNFTPALTGYYVIFLKVTDSVSSTAVSNNAYVTVSLPDYYLTVKTDPVGIVTIPEEGWYTQGTNVVLNASSPVPGSSSVQYRFSYWDVDGISKGLGVNPITVTMNANHTATAHYIKQYQITFAQTGLDLTASGTVVTVNSTGKVYGDLPYKIWVDTGGSVTYSYNSPVSSSVSGKRFVLISVTGPASPINVIGSLTVTGNYKTQYQITVTASPSEAIGGQFKVTYTQCGTTYTDVYKITVWTEWVDADTTVTVSEPQTIISHTLGTSYKFESYNPSNTVTMDQAKTITLLYKTQYLVSFTQTGSAVAPNVTYTADTDPTQTVPFDVWVRAGSQITYTYQDIVLGSLGVRYVFTSANPASPQTVNGPLTITGNYKTQYYLTVSSLYDSPTPTSGWFDNGTSITASVTSPWPGPGVQFVCTGWTGTGSVPPLGAVPTVTFAINAASSITWNWKTQYFLTVTSPYGTTVGQGWYDSGATAYAGLTSGTVDHGNGTRRLFTQWSGDASGTNYAQSNQIIMSAPKTALANWKTQYLLTVVTDPSGLTPQPTRNPAGEAGPANGWWYDASTSVTLTAQSVTSYSFNRWDVDGSLKTIGENPISVSMNTHHTATAHYTQVITYTLAITATAGGTTNPASGTYTYSGGATVDVAATPNVGYRFDHWVLNGSNVGSTSPISVLMDRNRSLQAVFAETHTLTISVSQGGTTNPAPGTYTYQTPTDVSVTATPNVGYRLDHWIYDNNNIGSQNSVIVHVGSSHTLRAVFAPASPSPVGGHSFSLIKQTPVSHMTAYTMLIALFGVVLILIKRKRK
jgi:hypothetical protein